MYRLAVRLARDGRAPLSADEMALLRREAEALKPIFPQ